MFPIFKLPSQAGSGVGGECIAHVEDLEGLGQAQTVRLHSDIALPCELAKQSVSGDKSRADMLVWKSCDVSDRSKLYKLRVRKYQWRDGGWWKVRGSRRWAINRFVGTLNPATTGGEGQSVCGRRLTKSNSSCVPVKAEGNRNTSHKTRENGV